MATRLTLEDIKASDTNRRRRDLVGLLQGYGFSLETDINDGHLRMRWEDPLGSEKPVTVGIAGHGANPEVLPAYVGEVAETIERVDSINKARDLAANKDEEAIVKTNMSGIDDADKLVLEAYEVAEGEGVVYIRNREFPEIGLHVQSNSDAPTINSAVEALETMIKAHKTSLKKLENDYGYQVIIGRRRGTLLDNPGYGVDSIRIPKYMPDAFPIVEISPPRRLNNAPQIIESATLDEALTLATSQAEAIQERILRVFHILEKINIYIDETTKKEGDITVRTFDWTVSEDKSFVKAIVETVDFFLQKNEFLIDYEVEELPKRYLATRFLSAKGSSNPVGTTVDKKQGRITTYQAEGDRAPIMTIAELVFFEAEINSLLYKEGRSILKHQIKLGQLQEVPDQVESARLFKQTFTGAEVQISQDALDIRNDTNDLELWTAAKHLKSKGYGAVLANEIFAHILVDTGFEVPQPSLRYSTLIHWLMPENGKLSFNHPLIGDVEIETDAQDTYLTPELLEAQKGLVEKIEAKLHKYLEDNGFERIGTEPIADGTESPKDHFMFTQFIHKEKKHEISLPKLTTYIEKGEELVSRSNSEGFGEVFEWAHQIICKGNEGSEIENAEEKLRVEYGFTDHPKVERKLEPPFKLKCPQCKIPDGSNPIATGNFLTRILPKIEGAMEELKQRTQKALETLGNDRVTIKNQTAIINGSQEITLYGQAGIASEKDLRVLEREAGIEPSRGDHKR